MSIAQRTRSIHFHSIKSTYVLSCRGLSSQDGQPVGTAMCVGDGVSASNWDPMDNCDRNLTTDEMLVKLEDVSPFSKREEKQFLEDFNTDLFVCFFLFAFILFFDMFKIISFFLFGKLKKSYTSHPCS